MKRTKRSTFTAGEHPRQAVNPALFRPFRDHGVTRSAMAVVAALLTMAFNPSSSRGQGYFLSNAVGDFSIGVVSVGTSLSGWQFVAQPFKTSAASDGMYLNSITVEMKQFLFARDHLFASVFDEVLGTPGNELVRLEGTWEEGLQSFVPDTPFTLEGDKTYYLVFGSDPSEEGNFQLVTVPAGGARGEGDIPGSISIINNTLGNWRKFNDGEAVRMDLTATTVPEPSAIALLVPGILLCLRLRRRTVNP